MAKSDYLSLIWSIPVVIFLLGVVFAALGTSAAFGIVAFDWVASHCGIKVEYNFDLGLFTAFFTAVAGAAIWKLKAK